MTQISHITSKDIHQVEKIGKICLPIYYQLPIYYFYFLIITTLCLK